MTTRYRGIVRAGDVQLVRVRIEGEIVASHATPGTLTLELADGSPLQLEVPQSARLDGEELAQRGAWGELRELPEAHGFARELEQPFTEVELVRVGFAPGTPIDACGVQVDVAFAADGGPREAPSEVPVVRAELVAAGPRATRLVEAMLERREAAEVRRPAPRPDKPTDPGDPATSGGFPIELVLVVILGGGALGLARILGDLSVRAAYAPLVAIAGAAFVARSARRPPVFWQRDDVVEGRDLAAAGMLVILGVAVLSAAAANHLVGPLALVYEIVPLTIAAIITLGNRGTYRLLEALVAGQARPLADAHDAWIVVEGKLKPGPGGAAKDGVLVRAQTKIRVGVGDDAPDEIEGRKVHGARSFVIVTDAGDEIAIDRDEISWASTDRTISDREHAIAVTDEDRLAVGDRIAAVGKLEHQSSGKRVLRSAGTRPVVVLVTGAAGRPRAFARALVASRRASLVGLAASVAGIAALALLVR